MFEFDEEYTPMPFGKYKGVQMGEFISTNLRYCTWAITLPHFKKRSPSAHRDLATLVAVEIMRRVDNGEDLL